MDVQMTLLMKDIWRLEALSDYKVHFARWNGENQPLEVFMRNKREWQEWQEYRPTRNEFNRPSIFALAQFYHEPDAWLFAGIFHVLTRRDDRYEVALSEEGRAFIGRLKLFSRYRGRTTRVNLENFYDSFEVLEILREPYTGRGFPGYEDINVSFEELETLVTQERPDWKAALESVKGIYLISDTRTGKRYIGSAYGEDGIWSRWCAYVANGHGGNIGLRQLVTDPNLEYCRANFRFALLEHRPTRTPDETILMRETFWKEILLTRGDYGLNRN